MAVDLCKCAVGFPSPAPPFENYGSLGLKVLLSGVLQRADVDLFGFV